MRPDISGKRAVGAVQAAGRPRPGALRAGAREPSRAATMKKKQVRFLKELLETPSATGTEDSRRRASCASAWPTRPTR